MKLHLCLGLLVLVIGCVEPRTSFAPSFRALGQAAAAEDHPSDETIGINVRRQLDLIGPAESVAMMVEVVDGVVTLRGSAPNQNAVWKAEAAARSVKGVKNVFSAILLQGPAR